MKRYRWLQAGWPISMRTLGKRLRARPFGADVSHGFVIDRLRDDLLEGRYVERLEYTETVVDPFGIELSFERVEFRQSSFRASPAGPGLELRDPTRSVQALLNQLSEAADFEVAITAQAVDVLAWSTQFQRLADITSVVDSLQINSLELEPGIRAKMIVKGERDVRSACAAMTGARKFAMEKIQLRLSKPNAGTIVLGSAATVSFGVDDPEERMLQALRDSLPHEAERR